MWSFKLILLLIASNDGRLFRVVTLYVQLLYFSSENIQLYHHHHHYSPVRTART